MTEHITIIGAGITGLAVAELLSPTHKVAIIARDQPGDLGLNWASPWAGAVWHPQKGVSSAEEVMQRASFRYYWNLANQEPSSRSGVQKLPITEYYDDRTDDEDIWYRDLVPEYQVLKREDLPEKCTFGVKYVSLAMNPQLLLPWLKGRLESKGVKFIRREVRSFGEARKLTGSRIVVNASGLGARELAKDDSVVPIRGQTMFVKTRFKQLVMKEGSEYTYVIPRAESGGVIIGGIKSDRLDAEVDVELKGDILARINRVTRGVFKDVDLDSVTDIVGFRPGRKSGLRVEREGDVIHAYGNAGAGYIYSFGVAEKVRQFLGGDGILAKL